MYKEMENVIAVTNRKLCKRPFLEQIERVCQAHPKAVILREKDLTEEAYKELAEQVLQICSSYQVSCILHTYVDVARNMGQTTIHLPLPVFRKYEGKLAGFLKVGTSVHSLEDAMEAQKLGAAYLTAGHIYTTDCKKGLAPRGLDFLQEICSQTTLPVYAIGGIHLHSGQMEEVMKHGAVGGCIMSGMMLM